MKNLILVIAFGLTSLSAFSQTKKDDAPKLPTGVEEGLSITYNEYIQLVFVTEKKVMSLEDIEEVKKYVAYNYRLYYAEAPQVVHKKRQWILTFEKK